MSPVTKAEMAGMGDRELWEATFRHVREMNGGLRQLNADFYGDPPHGHTGVQQKLAELETKVDCVEDTVGGMKSMMRVAWSIVGAIGIAVLTVLSLLVGGA